MKNEEVFKPMVDENRKSFRFDHWVSRLHSVVVWNEFKSGQICTQLWKRLVMGDEIHVIYYFIYIFFIKIFLIYN